MKDKNQEIYRKNLFERFKSLNEPVIDCSLISQDGIKKLKKLIESYNLENKTDFWVDERNKEIVNSNILDKKINLFTKIEKLMNYLELEGFYDLAITESKASVKNTLLKLYESDLDKAEIILASQLIVDRLQKTIESISSVIYEEVIPISDKIKITFGKKTSDYWFNNVKNSLDKLINVLVETKDTIFKVNASLEKSLEKGVALTDMVSDEVEMDIKDEKEKGEQLKVKDENEVENKNSFKKNDVEFRKKKENDTISKVEEQINEVSKERKELNKIKNMGFMINENNFSNDLKVYEIIKNNEKYKIYQIENSDIYMVEGDDKKKFNSILEAFKYSRKKIRKNNKKINEAIKIILEDVKNGIELEKSIESAHLITGLKKSFLIRYLNNYFSKKKS